MAYVTYEQAEISFYPRSLSSAHTFEIFFMIWRATVLSLKEAPLTVDFLQFHSP